MRIPLHKASVHESTRVSFVTIGNDIFYDAFRLPAGSPLSPGREAAATTADPKRAARVLPGTAVRGGSRVVNVSPVLHPLPHVPCHVLNAERLFTGYPVWQLYIFLVALSAGALLALYQLLHTVLARHRVKLLRDANIAVGHRLQGIAAGFGRVYHDVETAAGVIDHVIVGKSGAYAINVFARRPAKSGGVTLEGTALSFEPGGKAESIVQIAARTAALEREFRRLLDHRVRVRSVLAVPGWQINAQSGDDHLVVNDKNLAMLRGWKDRSDYLMDDDVDALHQLLTTRCSLRSGRKKPAD